MDKLNHELRKLLETLERQIKRTPLHADALKRVGRYLHGLESPKRETLDKLSILAGFQDWESFREAIYGEEEEEEIKKLKD